MREKETRYTTPEPRTQNRTKNPEEKKRLGRQFVIDLAVALNALSNPALPSDTSSAFISKRLSELPNDYPGLFSEDEKTAIKTSPAAIQNWLDGRTNPTPEKFTAIRQIL